MKKETHPMSIPSAQSDLERMMTIKKAALALGVEYRQLLTEVNSGRVAHYRAARGHRLVLPSQVIASLLQVATQA